MFRWRRRCDPKTKCRIPKQYDWLFIIILESAFLAIFAFCQALSINMSFWRCSGDNIANDTLLHRLHLSLAHQLSDSILETVHLKWLRTPPWHHISYHGLYHLEIGGRMGFVGVKQNSRIWQMLVNKLKRQRNVPSWQRHLSNWCYHETWLYHIIKGSHRQSHLPIHLSSLF